MIIGRPRRGSDQEGSPALSCLGTRTATNPNPDQEVRRIEGSWSELGLGAMNSYLFVFVDLLDKPEQVDQETKLERKTPREWNPAAILRHGWSRGAPNLVGRTIIFLPGAPFPSGALAARGEIDDAELAIVSVRASRRATALPVPRRRRVVPTLREPGQTFSAGMASAAMHWKEKGRWRGYRPGAARTAALCSTRPPTRAARIRRQEISRFASSAPGSWSSTRR